MADYVSQVYSNYIFWRIAKGSSSQIHKPLQRATCHSINKSLTSVRLLCRTLSAYSPWRKIESRFSHVTSFSFGRGAVTGSNRRWQWCVERPQVQPCICSSLKICQEIKKTQCEMMHQQSLSTNIATLDGGIVTALLLEYLPGAIQPQIKRQWVINKEDQRIERIVSCQQWTQKSKSDRSTSASWSTSSSTLLKAAPGESQQAKWDHRFYKSRHHFLFSAIILHRSKGLNHGWSCGLLHENRRFQDQQEWIWIIHSCPLVRGKCKPITNSSETWLTSI